MFPNNYFQRLELWRNLRTKIETANSPFDIVFDFWNSVPTDSISADPYDKNSWPDPWEMIKENTYCEFGKILAIMYTLQLTERFSQATFEIHITLDKDKSRFVYYQLTIQQLEFIIMDMLIITSKIIWFQCSIVNYAI